MALEQKPVEFFVVLKDRGNNISRLTYKSTVDANIAAEGMLADLIAAVDPITYAKIIKAGYTWVMEETDKTTDTTNGEVEKRAEISMALVTETPPGPGQTEWGQVSIPAPVDGLFLAASGDLFNVVDPADADLQTFLTMFTVGAGVLPHLALSDYQGAKDITVAGNVTGKRITKASRKG